VISVIVPVYNVEPYLRKCVDSILDQTFQDMEVILIDDGSPDRCGEICEEYAGRDSRVRAVHTQNRGLSAARNLGLKEARGGYIGFVDPDDWIEPRMYELLMKRLLETAADICVCDYVKEPASSGPEIHPAEGVYEGPDALKTLLRRKLDCHAWNKLYRRKVLPDGCFPEGRNYEDIAVMPRILHEAERVAVIPFAGYHYQARPEGITGNRSARNLTDLAEAYIESYEFMNSCRDSLHEDQEALLCLPARGISFVWRWWHLCGADEKRAYSEKIKGLLKFTREHFPLTGYSSWPRYLRFSCVFMHSGSRASFALLYISDQVFRRLRQKG